VEPRQEIKEGKVKEGSRTKPSRKRKARSGDSDRKSNVDDIAVCENFSYFLKIMHRYAAHQWLQIDKGEAIKMVFLLHQCAPSLEASHLSFNYDLTGIIHGLWDNYILNDRVFTSLTVFNHHRVTKRKCFRKLER
jgi:hypothetical protein